jgi:hypothetical protein
VGHRRAVTRLPVRVAGEQVTCPTRAAGPAVAVTCNAKLLKRQALREFPRHRARNSSCHLDQNPNR